jgi:hypothetical protein
MDLEKFTNHFGFRVVNIKHHSPYQYFDSYNRTASFYTDREQTTIEMEIDRRRLEHMINYVEQCQRLDDQDRDEEWLRRQHPGLKDAYDKYKMLLALYK